MNDDFNDLFDDFTTDQTDPALEPETEIASPEASTGQQEQATADPEPIVATTEPTVAETVEHEDSRQDKSVPLATFLDMRDRMKAAEKLADERQRQWDDHQRAQQQSIAPPDPNINPIQWAEQRFAQVEQQMFEQRLALCGDFAVKQHGEDAVKEAAVWAQSRKAVDPVFARDFHAQANPVEWIIQQHKRTTQFEQFQNDPIAAARKIAEEQGWLAAPASQAVAPVAAPQRKTNKVRPTSLSDIPTASGTVDKATMEKSFNSLFE